MFIFNFLINLIFLILIHFIAYFVILSFFVIFLNFFFKTLFPLFKNLILILKLNRHSNFVNFETLNFSKQKYLLFNNKIPDYDFKNLTNSKITYINHPSLIKNKNKKKLKILKTTLKYNEQLQNFNKKKFNFFKKTGMILQSKIFGLKLIYTLILKVKQFPFFNLNLKMLISFFFLIFLFYINLNIIYSLKFESTFLVFLFGFFVFLIYQFASNFIVNYLDNDSFILYNYLLDEINLKKNKINNLLKYQKIDLNKAKLNLNFLNLKFVLILTNLFSLFFNNLNANNFFFYFFLLNLIKKKK